jgi:hypothetical protein
VKDYRRMSHVSYMVVEHDGGWAYKVRDVFSETFATRAEAHTAAARAAQEQRAPGEGGLIDCEDSGGRWHEEQEGATIGPRLTSRTSGGFGRPFPLPHDGRPGQTVPGAG